MRYDYFPEFSSTKILIHIAFYYNEERFKYLRNVISAINTYDFAQVDICIDTNVHEFNHAKLNINLPDNINLNIITHDKLEHPFLLTWQHRKNISLHRDKYDYFMYLEDDISVSSDSLEKWRQDSILLFEHGKIRGFIRYEINKKNEIVSTDYLQGIKCKELQCINNNIYFKPKNPYQGFWIYSKKQLDKFIETKCWEDGNCDWEVRERASAGMIWNDKKSHILVVPIINRKIPEYVFVKHLPNNYANDKNNKHGKLKIYDLIANNTFLNICIKLIECICVDRK